MEMSLQIAFWLLAIFWRHTCHEKSPGEKHALQYCVSLWFGTNNECWQLIRRRSKGTVNDGYELCHVLANSFCVDAWVTLTRLLTNKPNSLTIGWTVCYFQKLCSSKMFASFFADVPSAPTDINVTDVFQTSCVVQWKPSKDDGGMPIQHYAVERLDMSVKGWFSFRVKIFLLILKYTACTFNLWKQAGHSLPVSMLSQNLIVFNYVSCIPI